MVPLFLRTWGTQVYGEWLALSAIPAYLALSDFGFGPVAANRIALLAGANGKSAAVKTLHTIWTMQVLLALVIVSLAVVAATFLPLQSWLSITAFGATDLRIVLVGLTAYVMANMFSGVVQAIYRAELRNARGMLIANSVRLAEVLGTMAVLFAGGGVRAMIGLMLAARLLSLLVLLWDASRMRSQLSIGVRELCWSELRALGRPATGHLGLALGGALQLQGFLLAVSHGLGPIAVVQYSVLRTATRFCVQLILVINGAIYPEFTTLVATKAFEKARELHRLAVQGSAAISAAYCVALLCISPILIPTWTGGRVQNDPLLLGILGVAVVLGCCWSTSSVVLSSTNNHARLGWVYSMAAAGSLAAGVVFSWWGGVWSLAAALAAGEFAVLLYVFGASCHLLGDRRVNALGDILTLKTFRRWMGAPRAIWAFSR